MIPDWCRYCVKRHYGICKGLRVCDACHGLFTVKQPSDETGLVLCEDSETCIIITELMWPLIRGEMVPEPYTYNMKGEVLSFYKGDTWQ